MNNVSIQQEAVDHVRKRIEQDGAHSLTGCPRFCRAMCNHYRVILRMKQDGAWPEELET